MLPFGVQVRQLKDLSPALRNFLANYSLVKLPTCPREVSITRPDKYYTDVWLVQCENDDYTRGHACLKYLEENEDYELKKHRHYWSLYFIL